MKNLKILLPLCLCAWLIFFCGNFRSTTNSNTAQKVNTPTTNINRFNIINTSTVTIYVKFYDQLTTPTYTNTPILTLQCEGGKEIWNSTINSPSNNLVNNFQYGCWVRTVTGSADSYTVSPSSSPIIEINY